jgi:DNA-binding CsgD family transcriptional regulator
LFFVPALYLGRAEVWLSSFEKYAGQAPPAEEAPVFVALTARRAICLAGLGLVDEARIIGAPLLDRVATRTDGWQAIHVLASLLETAVVLEHRGAARVLAERLACVAHLAIGDHFYTCVARHLGDAAKLLGDRSAARKYYMEAQGAAEKIRFRPELGLAHLSLADLLLEDGEESQALQHLLAAIPELEDMKMQPALEHGRSPLQQIQHGAPAPGTDAKATSGLTGRERELVYLMAAGRSNREIADTLVITEGTVEVHVKHILSKLGLRSRSQVAARVLDGQV